MRPPQNVSATSMLVGPETCLEKQYGPDMSAPSWKSKFGGQQWPSALSAGCAHVQTPFAHSDWLEHACPHLPQLSGSVRRFAQTLLEHCVCPGGQPHDPPRHDIPPGQEPVWHWPPQPSIAPQALPAQAGVQPPQWLGAPPPPQVCGDVQVSQPSIVPQPSSTLRHPASVLAQVRVGVHEQECETEHWPFPMQSPQNTIWQPSKT
jgi:hypothetical protein